MHTQIVTVMKSQDTMTPSKSHSTWTNEAKDSGIIETPNNSKLYFFNDLKEISNKQINEKAINLRPGQESQI
jgi:hypothetical protein